MKVDHSASGWSSGWAPGRVIDPAVLWLGDVNLIVGQQHALSHKRCQGRTDSRKAPAAACFEMDMHFFHDGNVLRYLTAGRRNDNKGPYHPAQRTRRGNTQTLWRGMIM